MERFLELWEKFDVNCYGSGEELILGSLKELFKTFEKTQFGYSYDYRKGIRALCNEPLFWALLSLMEHASFIDWGTSIRFGWTENDGTEFVKFILEHDVEEMYEAMMK